MKDKEGGGGGMRRGLLRVTIVVETRRWVGFPLGCYMFYLVKNEIYDYWVQKENAAEDIVDAKDRTHDLL